MLKILLLLLLVLLLLEAIALLVLKSQVGRYSKYWSDTTLNKPAPNALLYVALGDSTAQGIGATSARRGYVGLIASSLEKKYQRPVHVINLSRTGARVQDCIDDQLPQLATLQPDFITVEIGANDMKSFELEKFSLQIGAVMKALPKHAMISDVPYFGGGRFRHLEKNVELANNIIHTQAAKNNLPVVPLHTTTKIRDSLLTYAADLFHPSNIGYKNWHDAFWTQLDKNDLAY